MAAVRITEKARAVRLLVLDVDGVLTDGRLYFSEDGQELKTFDTQDGHGIKMLQQAGIQCAIITGRNTQLVARRAANLGIDLVFQGREDKGVALREACAQFNLLPQDCLYMGDDWPDLSAFAIAGMKVTVPNGHVEVRRRADLVTQAMGGRGAVREVCDMLLQAKGVYEELLEKFTAVPH